MTTSPTETASLVGVSKRPEGAYSGKIGASPGPAAKGRTRSGCCYRSETGKETSRRVDIPPVIGSLALRAGRRRRAPACGLRGMLAVAVLTSSAVRSRSPSDARWESGSLCARIAAPGGNAHARRPAFQPERAIPKPWPGMALDFVPAHGRVQPAERFTAQRTSVCLVRIGRLSREY